MADEEIISKTNKNIGLILSTHYEIIKICLNSLPDECLHNAAAVCKSWNNVIGVIRKKRSKVKCYSSMNLVSKPTEKSRPRRDNMNLRFVSDTMKPARGLLPKFCIGFSMYQTNVGVLKMHKVLRSSLPAECCSILAISYEGLISTLENNTIVTEHTTSSETFCAMTFPDIPGVSIKHFKVDAGGCRGTQFDLYQDGKYTKFLPKDSSEPVKCVFLFSTPKLNDVEPAEDLYRFIRKRQTEPFAFGGCLSSQTSVQGVPNALVHGTGVIFSGNGLRAASIVIKVEEDTDEELDVRMQQLKDCNFSLKNSMAFMFACVGRSSIEQEASIFRRHFPDTPLLGIQGNGEIGVNHLPKEGDVYPEEDSAQPKRRRKMCVDVDHIYSTVFVLLSWDTAS